MWNRRELERRIKVASLTGGCWGQAGLEAARRIEECLNVRLGTDIRTFTINVGNLRIDPFNIIIAGDEAGCMDAVTETLSLREGGPATAAMDAVKIMDHAGEIYLYHPEGESVAAYDSLRPFRKEETMRWESFEEVVDWVFREAEEMKKDDRFSF